MDNDKEEAIKSIYESVKSRLELSLDDFIKAINDWEIIPLKHDNKVIGGVMIKGNELHVGYGSKPVASIRSHIKATLASLINKYGSAVTVVVKENEAGLNFCKRLGFVVISEEQGKIVMKCDRCKYV